MELNKQKKAIANSRESSVIKEIKSNPGTSHNSPRYYNQILI